MHEEGEDADMSCWCHVRGGGGCRHVVVLAPGVASEEEDRMRARCCVSGEGGKMGRGRRRVRGGARVGRGPRHIVTVVIVWVHGL